MKIHMNFLVMLISKDIYVIHEYCLFCLSYSLYRLFL